MGGDCLARHLLLSYSNQGWNLELNIVLKVFPECISQILEHFTCPMGIKRTHHVVLITVKIIMSDSEQNEAGEICPVCLDTLVGKSTKVLRFCKHKVCQECYDHLLQVKGDHIERTVKRRCPLCRGPIRLYDVSTY